MNNFDNKAGSLFLDTTGITSMILLPYWNIIDLSRTRVDDIMYPLIEDERNIYGPQWAVTGKYVGLFKGQKRIFYIDTKGPHILFLTEINKGIDTTPYRLQKAMWTAYWEDNHKGYLFQIVERQN